MKLKLNHQGFAGIEVILILIVLSIIGFTGWFVYHSKQVSSSADQSVNKTSSNATQKSTAASKTGVAESSLVTYKTTKGGLSFQYPASWQVYSDGVHTKVNNYTSGGSEAFSVAPPSNVASDTKVRFGYVYLPYSGNQLDLPEDFYQCGGNSFCDTFHVKSIEPVQVGGSYGTMYLVQESEDSPNNAPMVESHMYLYKPISASNLPKVGDNSFTNKGYNFVSAGAGNSTIVISVSLPTSTLADSSGIFTTTDAQAALKILESVKSQN